MDFPTKDYRSMQGMYVPCAFCNGEGCPICEAKKMQRIQKESMTAEAMEFLNDLRSRMEGPTSDPSPASVHLAMYAIQHGKMLARAERSAISDEIANGHWADYIEFEHVGDNEPEEYEAEARLPVEL